MASANRFARNFFFARAAIVSAGKNIIFRYTDGYGDAAHWSQNKHDFPAFSYRLEILNEAEKEKNNGKGNSASAPSRFASLSERHTGKAKQITNWSASTFKGKLKFYRYKIVKYKPRAFNRKIEIKPHCKFKRSVSAPKCRFSSMAPGADLTPRGANLSMRSTSTPIKTILAPSKTDLAHSGQ